MPGPAQTPKIAPMLAVPGGGRLRARRAEGCDTGWRELPTPLLETPERGEWTLQTREERWTVRPGEVLYILPGTPHRLTTRGGAGMVSSWLLLQWESDGLPIRFQPGCGVIRDAAAARQLLDMTGWLEGNPSLAEQAGFHAAALAFLARIGAHTTLHTGTDPRVARALAHIHEHLAEPLNRGALARAAGVSESRLHDLFKAEVGEAPIQYINRRRLQRAAHLLVHSTLAVAEIGERCGFRSAHYFSRAFQQSTGLPPRAFRQQFH